MIQRGKKSAASLSVVAPDPPPIPKRSGPKPPAHLSNGAKEWWAAVVGDYHLEPHHLRLLQAACEAWDRAQEARKVVATQGLTVTASNGDVRAHPLIAVERDARTLFARLVRELDLDAEGPAERSRPPALTSNRRGGYAG